jgi:hypothetical protein
MRGESLRDHPITWVGNYYHRGKMQGNILTPGLFTV